MTEPAKELSPQEEVAMQAQKIQDLCIPFRLELDMLKLMIRTGLSKAEDVQAQVKKVEGMNLNLKSELYNFDMLIRKYEKILANGYRKLVDG